MALTRAQLLMGNITDGVILSGQPQGVRPGGPGITIDTNGIISVNSQTIIGVMKLGQTPAAAAGAYNAYNWPAGQPFVGQQLTVGSLSGGQTNLIWDDPDGIPWTAKGQLVAATGAGSANQTVVNVGPTHSFLMSDPGTVSGLAYSNTNDEAMLLPVGVTGARPAAVEGYFRYNSTTKHVEFYNGGSWQEVASGNSPTPPIPATIVSSVGGAAPIVSSGGTTPTISITAATTGAAGSMSAADKAKLDSLPSGPVVTSVNVSGGSTGMSFSGGPVTSTGTMTMAGTLAVANGGTGATSSAGALNNLLPSQGGNAGKVLQTDGSNVSWQPGGGSGPTSVAGWLSFDGFTATILDGYAFSSVTYLSTGYYQMTFTTPRPDTNYCITIGVTDNDPGPGSYVNFGWINAFSRTTTGFVLRTAAAGSGPADSPNVSIMITDNT